MKFCIRGVLRSLITNPNSKFRNSIWRIQYGGPKCKNLLDLDGILYSGVIEVTDYESEFKIQKFNMANPIWRTKMQKVTWFRWNYVFVGYWGRWLRIRIQNWEIHYDESNMADQNAKSYLIWMKFCIRGLLRSLITNPNSKFKNSIWRIQYGGPKCKKLLDLDEILYSGAIEVADNESELKIHKLNMADQNAKS